MHALRIDLVLALRRMRGQPLFTAAIIVMLSVAIGATTAAIGVAYGVLLSPLPIHDQDRVVVLEKAHPISESVVVGFSARHLADYKRNSRVLESVAADDASRLGVRVLSTGAAGESHRPVASVAIRVATPTPHNGEHGSGI